MSDETAVMLSDILPTGYECGVLNGAMKPGDVVAIVGAGPVGRAACMGSPCPSRSIVKVDRLWSHNLTPCTLRVDTESTPMLLKTVMAGKDHREILVTHRTRCMTS